MRFQTSQLWTVRLLQPPQSFYILKATITSLLKQKKKKTVRGSVKQTKQTPKVAGVEGWVLTTECFLYNVFFSKDKNYNKLYWVAYLVYINAYLTSWM